MPSSSAIAPSKSLIEVSAITDLEVYRVAPLPPGVLRNLWILASDAHLTGELTSREGHVHEIAAPHRRRVAKYPRLVGVPRDRVAAAEHRQRAERAKPAG